MKLYELLEQRFSKWEVETSNYITYYISYQMENT